MPPRRASPERLLAALDEQRAALGEAGWAGPLAAPALSRACADAALAALDAGLAPREAALRVAVRDSLDQLAARAPGRAVEVRVPPYAAVQCVAGPRHSRGTPPNVIETDPATWIRLAAGRVSWAEAAGDGRVRASGPRADLSELLPLRPVPGRGRGH